MVLCLFNACGAVADASRLCDIGSGYEIRVGSEEDRVTHQISLFGMIGPLPFLCGNVLSLKGGRGPGRQG
jgi:hypothetical protein